jgi:hypothetical protein
VVELVVSELLMLTLAGRTVSTSSNSSSAYPLDLPLDFSSKKRSSRTAPNSEAAVSICASVVHQHKLPMYSDASAGLRAGHTAVGRVRPASSADTPTQPLAAVCNQRPNR